MPSVCLGERIKQALQNIILQKYSVYLHKNVAFAVLQIVQIRLKISVHRTMFLPLSSDQPVMYFTFVFFKVTDETVAFTQKQSPVFGNYCMSRV